MKKSILSLLVAFMVSAISGLAISHYTGADAKFTVGSMFALTIAASLFMPKQLSNVVKNVTYSPAEFTGSFYEEIFNEILYMNKTVERGLVRLIDNVNTETILTESNVSVSTQAYKASPLPADASGSLAFADKILRPYQFMRYDEFTPNTIMFSRMGKPNSGDTSFPKVTDEFQRQILARYGAAEAELMESRFWNAATTATKTAVAALTAGTGQNAVGTAEKTYVAAAPTDLIDGVLTKLILSYNVTKRRFKVAGTTITATNIADEYGKIYEAIIPKLLQPNYAGSVRIYAPHNHLQLINTYNTNATYRDLFQVSGGNYYYNGVQIEFVPLPNNAMIAGIGTDLVWGCDITDAKSSVKIDFLRANSDDMFVWMKYTQESSFVQAQQFVVYLG
jgi:hypothetical protein